MPMRRALLVNNVALSVLMFLCFAFPAFASSISWSSPTETELAGSVTVNAMITSTSQITNYEIRAVEAGNATHAQLVTSIPGSVTLIGSMPPVMMYSVYATWPTMACHNGSQTLSVRVQLANGTWEEHTKSVTVNNLSFGTEPDREAFLCTGDSSQPAETLQVNIGGKSLTNINVAVQLLIYEAASATDNSTLRPRLARTITQTISNPGTVTFSWDHKEADGTQSPRGLYSYDVKASRIVNGGADNTALRSDRVSVLRALDSSGNQVFNATSLGINDKDTDDESDDEEEFFVRSYRLVDSRGVNVNRLHVSMYDYYLTKVYQVESSSLGCQVSGHTDCHGLTTAAYPGMQHEMKIPVPLSACQEASDYRFLTWVVDSDAANDRVHMARKTVAINQLYDDRPIIYITTDTACIAYVPPKYSNRVHKELMLTKPRLLNGYPVSCDLWASLTSNPTGSYYKNGAPYKTVRASINGGFATIYGKSPTFGPLIGSAKQGARRAGREVDYSTRLLQKRSFLGFDRYGANMVITSDLSSDPATYSFRDGLGCLMLNGVEVDDAQANWLDGDLSRVRSVFAWSDIKRNRRAIYLVNSRYGMTWSQIQSTISNLSNDIRSSTGLSVYPVKNAVMLASGPFAQIHYANNPPNSICENRGNMDDHLNVPDFIAVEGAYK